MVGNHGTLLHSADGGGSWEHVLLGSDAMLVDVWASKDTVVLVGADATMLVSSDRGTSFRTVKTGTRAVTVWGIAGHVYVGGGAGLLLHGTGSSRWGKIKLPQAGNVTAIWGTSATNFYCLLESEHLVHTRDGGVTWTEDYLRHALGLYGLWGPSATDVWSAGRGKIFRGASR